MTIIFMKGAYHILVVVYIVSDVVNFYCTDSDSASIFYDAKSRVWEKRENWVEPPRA